MPLQRRRYQLHVSVVRIECDKVPQALHPGGHVDKAREIVVDIHLARLIACLKPGVVHAQLQVDAQHRARISRHQQLLGIWEVSGFDDRRAQPPHDVQRGVKRGEDIHVAALG